MRILYIHKVFPGKFAPLVRFMAVNQARVSVFMAERWAREAQIPGVRRVRIPLQPSIIRELPEGRGRQNEGGFALSLKTAAKAGDMFQRLRKGGFVPDVIYAIPEEGHTLFARDVFPDVRLVLYLEGLHRSFPDAQPDVPRLAGEARISSANVMRDRVQNLFILSALHDCDFAITASEWQRSLFGGRWRDKIRVVQRAVDAGFFVPEPAYAESGSVTLFCNGLSPASGFETMRDALREVLANCPDCRVRLLSFASAQADDAKTHHAELFREQLSLLGPDERQRVDIVVSPTLSEYRTLLQRSSVVVFPAFTMGVPGSVLEAMSCGCLVVVADTGPARELVKERENGFMYTANDAQALARQVENCLRQEADLGSVKRAARRSVVEQHDVRHVIPHQAGMIACCAS